METLIDEVMENTPAWKRLLEHGVTEKLCVAVLDYTAEAHSPVRTIVPLGCPSFSELPSNTSILAVVLFFSLSLGYFGCRDGEVEASERYLSRNDSTCRHSLLAPYYSKGTYIIHATYA